MKLNPDDELPKPAVHPKSIKFKDISNKKFGKLKVLYYVKSKNGAIWLCICDCGSYILMFTSVLRNRKFPNCGCCNNIKHGHSRSANKTPTYIVWNSMRQRCNNPKHKRYLDYGGRGIKTCDRWNEFSNFLEDMGEVPNGHTIERKNNNLGYYKENCKWATKKEQARNRRSCHLLTYNNQSKSIVEWAEDFNLEVGTLGYRIRNGWNIESALTTPVKRLNKCNH